MVVICGAHARGSVPSDADSGLEVAQYGLSKAWLKSTKILTSEPFRIVRFRLPIWSPRDPPMRHLETSDYMAKFRIQRRSSVSASLW